jgi:hypothetical protein
MAFFFFPLLLNTPSGSKLTIWKDFNWVPDGSPFDPIDTDRRTLRTNSLPDSKLAERAWIFQNTG